MTDKTAEIRVFDIIVLILSLVTIAMLAIEATMKIPKDIRSITFVADTVICGVFLVDFFSQLYRAPNKLHYMRWGWIDLLSSLPALEMFRVGRLFRVIRILRLLRGVKSLRILSAYIHRHKSRSTFASAVLLTFFILIFSLFRSG